MVERTVWCLAILWDTDSRECYTFHEKCQSVSDAAITMMVLYHTETVSSYFVIYLLCGRGGGRGGEGRGMLL